MSFATEWLEKKALFQQFISEPPDDQTGIIIVVPAYNEPSISNLLDSLLNCKIPDCATEVIIVVNAPSNAGSEIKKINSDCIKKIESWKRRNKSFFRLFSFDAGEPAVRGWGVGLARKTGMDEALRRFSLIGEPKGVIACLDADCKVAVNYLTELYENLYRSARYEGCSIYFEHPLQGEDFTGAVFQSIAQYELHLRYYLMGLKFSGFPTAFHTVGSSMAVQPMAYMKYGGMNRRQAGEDFYFIQKVSSSGRYLALNTTAVFPSPRESDRVPFGTGAAMNRLMATKQASYMTYNPASFAELRKFFSLVEELFLTEKDSLRGKYELLPPGISSFLSEEGFVSSVSEIKGNTSGKESFAKRFFHWFNMFTIMKYLNHVHESEFEKLPVGEASSAMLGMTGYDNIPFKTGDILEFYRKIERGINYSSAKSFCPPVE
jgi:glycosyltransferase involved in cell wall biosynthesis